MSSRRMLHNITSLGLLCARKRRKIYVHRFREAAAIFIIFEKPAIFFHERRVFMTRVYIPTRHRNTSICPTPRLTRPAEIDLKCKFNPSQAHRVLNSLRKTSRPYSFCNNYNVNAEHNNEYENHIIYKNKRRLCIENERTSFHRFVNKCKFM